MALLAQAKLAGSWSFEVTSDPLPQFLPSPTAPFGATLKSQALIGSGLFCFFSSIQCFKRHFNNC